MEKFILFLLSLLVKITIAISKSIGRQGSSIGGRIALVIYPPVISVLAKQIRKDIIIICGTNGKTSTNNMIFKALEQNSIKCACNNKGANMFEGIATCLIEETNFFGVLDADYACFEVDEAYLTKLADKISASKILVTNIFMDQLDRYTDISNVTGLLEEGIRKFPNAVVFINADNPLATSFNIENRIIYYGMNKFLVENVDTTEEFCPKCDGFLVFKHKNYEYTGDYYCTSCDFKRPEPCITYEGEEDIEIYSQYNILAARAILDSIEEKKPMTVTYESRIKRYNIHGISIILNMAKNAVGFNQALGLAVRDLKDKEVIIALNDNPSDGIDISWIWDVNFERLADIKTAAIGKRRLELMLRFKYGDIKSFNDYNSIESALLNVQSDICYIIANYTSFAEIKAYLDRF